jgi:hypothetical protein
MRTRTEFVDAETANALSKGIDQIVILGAGYDGRALRFGPSARWIEVDRPLTPTVSVPTRTSEPLTGIGSAIGTDPAAQAACSRRTASFCRSIHQSFDADTTSLTAKAPEVVSSRQL